MLRKMSCLVTCVNVTYGLADLSVKYLKCCEQNYVKVSLSSGGWNRDAILVSTHTYVSE